MLRCTITETKDIELVGYEGGPGAVSFVSKVWLRSTDAAKAGEATRRFLATFRCKRARLLPRSREDDRVSAYSRAESQRGSERMADNMRFGTYCEISTPRRQ